MFTSLSPGAIGVQVDSIQQGLTLAAKHGLHPNLISQWKRQAIEQMASLFGGGGAEAVKEKEGEVEKLHAKIGQLLVERDFLAKAFGR